MQDRCEAPIRKISIGPDPKMGMSFSVGQTFQVPGNNVSDPRTPICVSSITVDGYTSNTFLIKRYDVWVSVVGAEAEGEYLWKSFEGVPVSPEYIIKRVVI